MMDIYQLKTFVTVARQGSITRSAELLFLSQPAISAHIKTLEDELGLSLFERTPRGMSLTTQGLALLTKAEQLLALHQEIKTDARQLSGQLSGRVRLGSNRSPSAQVLSKLLTQLAERCPQLEVSLEYGSAVEIVDAIRMGRIDAGFYTADPLESAGLQQIEVDSFGVYLAAPPGWVHAEGAPDWQQISRLPWICPATNTCCGRLAEQLFVEHGFRPAKIIHVDQEHVTRTLVAGGVGLGLLHQPTALDAQQKAELVLLGPPLQQVQVWFGFLSNRQQEPLLLALLNAVQQTADTSDPH
ncbi:MAG: LysR family transcriptional regulator [Gammaproteobacteria bacterium]|nr:LysR family transcriptional regulator [Gammaproteobacteria bacterium]MBU2425558.1 LysR family transcriptional regulator [Gammaproteobacteria bacterium]